jgi:hypothetical protein
MTIADNLTGLIEDWSEGTERSLYARELKFGVSDIGGCHEYLRRLIAEVPFSDPRTNFMPAFMGTAFGEMFERAYRERYPDAETQLSITVPLHLTVNGEPYLVHVPGHPDIVHGDTVIDGKTKNGLAVVRREGGERKHQYQVSLYTHALIEAGKIDPDNARCALAYYDRSGVEEEPFVVEWDYDPAITDEALDWINSVLYDYEQGVASHKDMPREWCFSYCPYATDCRGSDTDVEGVIEDPTILTAIELYLDAHAREKQAAKEKKDASAELRGAAGHTPTHTLRWIEIGPSEVAFTRAAHQRLDLRERK